MCEKFIDLLLELGNSLGKLDFGVFVRCFAHLARNQRLFITLTSLIIFERLVIMGDIKYF